MNKTAVLRLGGLIGLLCQAYMSFIVITAFKAGTLSVWQGFLGLLITVMMIVGNITIVLKNSTDEQ